MNWLIITSNVAFCVISASLCVLGWNTLKAIKYLNLGKFFWIPIFISSVLFAVSSLITILNDVFLSLTTAIEVEQVTQLVALCFLSVGIFSYSKIIRRNIPEKNLFPEDIPMQSTKDTSYSPLTTSIYHEKAGSNKIRKTASSECNHEMGYLAAFPSNASFPEECMNCKKIIECKQA